MEWIKEIVSSNAGILFSLLLTIILTIFSKMIISIFRMGVMFKSELATKQELDAFKKEVRSDMRAYKAELTRVVMDSCIKIIEEKLKDINNIRDVASNMKASEARVNEQMKVINEKVGDLTSIIATVQRLSARVENLSAAQGNNNTMARRREA